MTGYRGSKDSYRNINPDYSKVRRDDVPDDAEIFINCQWYKIGLHNFLYVLRPDNVWKRAQLDPVSEKKIMKSINDRRPAKRRVKLG